MIVGAWFAPTAVRMRVLYASFSKNVAASCPSGCAALKASTDALRRPSWGAPVRYQMLASPARVWPGPDVPQAASALAPIGAAIASARNDRRETRF
jgi:hypothetical protein